MEEEFLKESKTRKRIGEIYTKDESDFATQAEYDDYLEMREDIILALIAGEDLDRVEEEIARYKQENQESIHRHKRRKLEETGASYTAAATDRLTAELPVASETDPEKKTVGGPQPVPLESGHELTEEGSLKTKRRPRTSSEWHVMARAGGWTRHTYNDYVRRHALDHLRGI